MPASFVQTYVLSPTTTLGRATDCSPLAQDLDQRDFAAERTGFFPSLQMTLNHIYMVDLFYVGALERGWLGPKAWENPILYPSFADLKRTQVAVEKRLIAVSNTLIPDALGGIVPGQPRHAGTD
jgi:hypothetical protein